MDPWKFDADTFVPGEGLESQVVTTDVITKYLAVGQHDSNFILVAPKGLGKTLLLRTKAHLYQTKLQDTMRNNGFGGFEILDCQEHSLCFSIKN